MSRATLLFHSKDYRASLRAAEEALALVPADVAALELSALDERFLGEDARATGHYEKLLEVAEPVRHPAYHFELGTLHFKAHRLEQARPHFAAAESGGFRPALASFLGGFIDYSASRWEDCRREMLRALRADLTEALRPAARYYLAAASRQLGLVTDALTGYHAALEAQASRGDTGLELGDDFRKMQEGIARESRQGFDSFDQRAVFAALSLIAQWDTNVQSSPTEAPNPLPQTMRQSFKTLVTGAAGLSTSPTREWQLVPSLRFYANYNWNPVTRDYAFLSATPSLLVVREAYRRLVLGFKSELTYISKNSLDAANPRAETNYSSYSLIGDVGPTARYELQPGTWLVGELVWRPKQYFQDAVTGDSRRTGHGFASKLGAELSLSALLNPSAFLAYEEDHPAGVLYRFRAVGAGVSNTARVLDRLSVSGYFEFSNTDYYAVSTPHRRDALVSLRGLAQYGLDAHWAALGDLSYLANGSSIAATYKYDRFVVSTGVSYRF